MGVTRSTGIPRACRCVLSGHKSTDISSFQRNFNGTLYGNDTELVPILIYIYISRSIFDTFLENKITDRARDLQWK